MIFIIYTKQLKEIIRHDFFIIYTKQLKEPNQLTYYLLPITCFLYTASIRYPDTCSCTPPNHSPP